MRYYFAHIFIWRYYSIQIVFLIIFLLWVAWMVWLVAYEQGREKGHDKGFHEGYDFGRRSVLGKMLISEEEFKRRYDEKQ